jgi:hypothetical protein
VKPVDISGIKREYLRDNINIVAADRMRNSRDFYR